MAITNIHKLHSFSSKNSQKNAEKSRSASYCHPLANTNETHLITDQLITDRHSA